jgi:hypothetical protein
LNEGDCNDEHKQPQLAILRTERLDASLACCFQAHYEDTALSEVESLDVCVEVALAINLNGQADSLIEVEVQAEFTHMIQFRL